MNVKGGNVSYTPMRSLNFAGQNGSPRHFYPNDLNNLGPRIGVQG